MLLKFRQVYSLSAIVITSLFGGLLSPHMTQADELKNYLDDIQIERIQVEKATSKMRQIASEPVVKDEGYTEDVHWERSTEQDKNLN